MWSILSFSIAYNFLAGVGSIETWSRVRPARKNGSRYRFSAPISRRAICDLEFAENAQTRIAELMRRYEWFSTSRSDSFAVVHDSLLGALSPPCAQLAHWLGIASKALGFEPQFTFSSDLKIDPSLRGQDRVIAIAKAVDATQYVNLSGGRELYDREGFERHGLQLSFLDPYIGSRWSLLYRLAVESPTDISSEIHANAHPRSS